MDIEIFTPIQKNAMPLREKWIELLWSVVNNTLYKYSPFFVDVGGDGYLYCLEHM